METEIPQPKLRNGAYYYDLLTADTTSHLVTATVNDKEKLVFDGAKFAIGLVTNSYKYDKELQFVAFTSKAPKLEKRVDKEHTYYRLEAGYLPGTHETAEALRNVADQLDRIIGYEPVSFQVDPRPRRTIKSSEDLAELIL